MNITTDQEAHFYIAEALLKQNERSIGIGEDCAYRGFSKKLHSELSTNLFGVSNPDALDEDQYTAFMESLYNEVKPDLKCAVGHVITELFYQPDMEGESVTSDYVMGIVRNSNPGWDITHQSKKMLDKLQNIHDTVSPAYWGQVLHKFDFDQDGNYIGQSDNR